MPEIREPYQILFSPSNVRSRKKIMKQKPFSFSLFSFNEHDNAHNKWLSELRQIFNRLLHFTQLVIAFSVFLYRFLFYYYSALFFAIEAKILFRLIGGARYAWTKNRNDDVHSGNSSALNKTSTTDWWSLFFVAVFSF